MIWNLKEKPKCCQETEDGECKNKAYGINRISPDKYYWVCRKNYNLYNLGKIGY